MRAGKIEQAAKIGEAIKRHNSAELSRVDVVTNAQSMWAKVCELTGRNKSTNTAGNNPAITTDQLNDHFASVFADINYMAPRTKNTVNNWYLDSFISELHMFYILDHLHPTAMGLDNMSGF